MADVLECEIAISEYELQSVDYVHFRTQSLGYRRNHRISIPNYGLNSTTNFFEKDGFGIKWTMKVDMPLKERDRAEPNQINRKTK